jgi:ATPase subunit of ABC transporter with duplicated ATPase domains
VDGCGYVPLAASTLAGSTDLPPTLDLNKTNNISAHSAGSVAQQELTTDRFIQETNAKNVGSDAEDTDSRVSLGNDFLFSPPSCLLTTVFEELTSEVRSAGPRNFFELHENAVLGSAPIEANDAEIVAPVITEAVQHKKQKSKADKRKANQQVEDARETFKFSLPRPAALEGVKSRKRIVLKMDSVGFTYPSSKRPTISNVNLEVSQSSCILVTGAKAAGKSTVMKALIGEQLPTSGTVSQVEGLRLAHMSQHSFSQLETHKDETPEEYINSCSDDEQIPYSLVADQLFLDFDLDPDVMRNTPIHCLGGGQKAKVALAFAMRHRAHIFVLDEPAAVLVGDALDALVMALQDYKGGVVIFAHTKDKALFDTVAKEVWCIRGGSLRNESKTDYGKTPEKSAKKSQSGVAPAAHRPSATEMSEAIKDVERRLKNEALTDKEKWQIFDELDALKRRMKS